MIDMSRYKAPWWLVVIIIVLMLPVFQLPVLLANCPPEMAGTKALLWCYPFYVLLTGWMAYACYPTRKAVSWILLFLMVLSHVSMYLLVSTETSGF